MVELRLVELTEEEHALIRRALESWREGMSSAAELTTEDHSIDDMTVFLEVMASYTEEVEAVDALLQKMGE